MAMSTPQQQRHMPAFLARLLRPFSSSARMSLSPDSSGQGMKKDLSMKTTTMASNSMAGPETNSSTSMAPMENDSMSGMDNTKPMENNLSKPVDSGTAPRMDTATASDDMAPSKPMGPQKATFAAGCFWGVEHIFRKRFSGHGLLDSSVGYCGGDTKNPKYNAVCSGKTGHAEALQITYDPEKVSYRKLVEFFYMMHDPTTIDRQGPDAGSQYRSAIFFHDEEQEKIALAITKKVDEEWWRNGKVVTVVAPIGQWYDAESYHQKYLNNNPSGYECPSHYVRKFPYLSE
ncbi:MAG: Peptide-methionine (S)-S-oxide reductase [Trizodia sp. TS-e1964]|nr:MAG: Peptide-methionine (S)-S-oxide reductase [Trizodia sp. TS-e1964]